MSKSKGQKFREKLVQRGKMNPNELRGSWNNTSGVTKRTPTKKEKLNKEKYKRNYSQLDYNGA